MTHITDKTLPELHDDLENLSKDYNQLIHQLIDVGQVELASQMLMNYMASGRTTQMIGMKTVVAEMKK